ncbi:MAG: TraR/DksA family transcriptional regulator [Victivallaceae bacterium]|nr:TraR/DksA family transcriptional regulator [Victivallaceae bacterium]
MKKKRDVSSYEGDDLAHYEALIKCMEDIKSKMSNAADALNASEVANVAAATHIADISSDAAGRDLKLRSLTENSRELKLIDEALERLARGEYGRCQSCGEMIPEGRLRIRPHAVYCVKCKTQIEKEQKG